MKVLVLNYGPFSPYYYRRLIRRVVNDWKMKHFWESCGKMREIRISTNRVCDCQFICFKQKQKQKRPGLLISQKKVLPITMAILAFFYIADQRTMKFKKSIGAIIADSRRYSEIRRWLTLYKVQQSTFFPFPLQRRRIWLSASSGSFVRCGSPYVSPLSDPPIPPTHTHPPLKTRLLELADRGTTVEFVKKGGGREKPSTAGLSTEWAISLSLIILHLYWKNCKT